MKRQRGISFEKWPLSDRESFCRAISGGSRRTKKWGAARLSPTTIRSLRYGYGYCLGWLADHDCLDPAAPPGDRWPAAVVEAMVDDMAEGYAVATTITRVKHLKKVLTMLEPAIDLTHLDRVLRQLGRVGPARSPLVHRVSIIDLIGCGQELMRYAEENEESPSVSRALVFQTGFQVALLALRPWRSSAFCAMRLGVHLVPTARAGGWSRIVTRVPGSGLLTPSFLTRFFPRFSGFYPTGDPCSAPAQRFRTMVAPRRPELRSPTSPL